MSEYFQQNVNDRLQAAWRGRRKPVPTLSYSLTLIYRNCRYLEDRSIVEPVMRSLARAIWVDEEGRLDDLARAKILAAFDDVWDAAGEDDDCVDELRKVVNAVTAEAGFGPKDFMSEDRDDSA